MERSNSPRDGFDGAKGRPSRVEHLFLVRVWYESGSANAAWRGSVENTATGARRYFTDFGTLTAFLALEAKPD